MRAVIEKLEQHLRTGDFLRAVKHVESIGSDIGSLNRLGRGSAFRMRAAAAIAEVLFYRGHNDDARTLVAEAADRGEWLDAKRDVPARARLQLVESDYSLRQFDSAKMTATQIRHMCEQGRDVLGVAEASYYLARCHMRLHETIAVYDACDRSIQSLANAEVPDSDTRLAFQWRMGLLLLVEGTVAAETGDKRCLGTLHGARLLLASPLSDLIARANVEHAIGSALRSRANSQAEREGCLRALHAALMAYRKAGHRLNAARAETNLGRTYLGMGDEKRAEEHFGRALKTANDIVDDVAKERQKAETLICMSWLHRSAEVPDLKRAIECAQSALAAVHMNPPGQLMVEAHISIGECQLYTGNTNEARDNFQLALQVAENRRIGKLATNAHLALAELHARRGDVQQALAHYVHAEKHAAINTSRYLREKADRVMARIKSRRDMWTITKEEAASDGLAKAKDKFEQWFVERLDEEPQLTATQKAQRLGIKTKAGYYKFRRRWSDRP